MPWHLYVRFQEDELKDAYWEEVERLPQIRPELEAHALRVRVYQDRPLVVFGHRDRERLAALLRWTLDFWTSAQISLAEDGFPAPTDTGDGASISLETSV